MSLYVCFRLTVKFHFVLLALTLTPLILTGVSGATINICEGVANNIFIADVNNCSNYYICISQKATLQTCRDQLFFDAQSQSCVTNSSVCQTCNPDVLSSYPLYKTCNKYVLCFAGTPVIQQCYDDLQYDSATDQCNYASKVDCVSNQCSIYNNANNIVYVPSYSACNKYFICMSGTAYSHTCATGLYFSSECNCCDVSSNVDCTITTPKTIADNHTNIGVMPIKTVDMDCPKNGRHFFPHAHSNQYYVCVNGKGAVLTCAEGLFYDIKTESCRELKHILID